MAHNSSFTKIWAEQGNGLSLYEIRRALGVNNEDLGYLCTNDYINEWTKYKPISFNTLGEVTENNRKLEYYGMRLRQNYNTLGTWDPIDCVTTARDTDSWFYKKPTGGSSSPYRQLDFNGYNSEAKCFYRKDGSVERVSVNSNYTIAVSVDAENGEITPDDFVDYISTSDKEEWNYVALVRKESEHSNPYLFVGDPVWIDDGYGHMILNENPEATASFPSKGIYDCCLAITKMTSVESPMLAYLVPGSYYRVNYDPDFAPFDIYVNGDHSPRIAFYNTPTEYYANRFSGSFDVTNVEGVVSNFKFNIIIESRDVGVVSNVNIISLGTLVAGTYSYDHTSQVQFYIGDEASHQRQEPDPDYDHYTIYGKLEYDYNDAHYVRYFDFTYEHVKSVLSSMSTFWFYDQYGIEEE